MAEYSTFRRTAWDPILIVAQIVTLQCFGYSTFSVLMAFASVLTELRLGPQLLFDVRLVRGDMVEGGRVDFSLTFFAVHLILVWWHQGTPPLALLWWAAVGASGALMAVGGRAACLRWELLPIAIRSYMPMRPPEAHSDHGGPAGAEEHELETRRPEAPATEVLFDASRVASGALPRTSASASASDGWSNDDWGTDTNDDSNGSTRPSATPGAPRQKHQQQSVPSGSATPLAIHTPAPKSNKGD
ncbi:hypothetical protein LPJ61_004666 [Coemansia biformis]|uniref:Integral membrane protein n=1 Tax=Coemansia biformis TaxID=1286918 RepID=A0A9W8CV44_9FUNG|nr:hypothetical protein LPJ61_004666 [Coemansia biformis]